MADHPQAIVWYLRIVDDTLTLMDAAAADESARIRQYCATITNGPASPESQPTTRPLSAGSARKWLAVMAVACTLLISASAALWLPLSTLDDSPHI